MKFQKRNSILLASGRICSSLGDSLYELAIIWYIFQLTNSTIYTGITLTLIALPQCLNFLFGPIINRFNTKNLLSYTQLLQCILMSSIPISIILGHENIYFILGVVFFLALLENFQGIAEMTIVPSIISKDFISKYNSIVNTIQQSISLTSSLIFSFVILYYTVSDIYIFNAITFLLAFIFFNSIIYNKHSQSTEFEDHSFKSSLIEGWRYFKNSVLLSITIPLSLANLILSAVNSVLPKYAEELGKSNYYAWLMFAISIGMLIGSILSVKFMNISIGNLIPYSLLFIFIFWIISVNSNNLLVSLIFLSISVIPIGIMNISILTYTQVTTEETMMTRVLSISDSLLFIPIPLGALLGGFLGDLVNARTVLLIASLAFLVMFLFNIFNSKLKSIKSINYYIKS
ncbi:MFS transporter [Mammaliicoccus sciuri]|uniref:MFS transporter n=1 Tax=Mammaliicoccus sciuri TaxID=1296 RepID=UPI00397A28B7